MLLCGAMALASACSARPTGGRSPVSTAESAAPQGTTTSLPASTAAQAPALAPFPFTVLRSSPHPLVVTGITGRKLAVYGHLLVDIDERAIRPDPSLLAGFRGHGAVGPGFSIKAAAGQWPDRVVVAARVAFFQALFEWKKDRWVPQNPKIARIAKQPHGGYLPETWQLGPWLDDSVLAAHWPPMSAKPQLSIAVGPSKLVPAIAPLSLESGPCDDLVITEVVTTPDGELSARGTEQCSGNAQPVLARWSKSAGAVTSLDTAVRKPKEAAAVFELADGRAYASAAGRFWQRPKSGAWEEVALPPVPAPPLRDRHPGSTERVLQINGVFAVGAQTWVSASVHPKGAPWNDPAFASYYVLLAASKDVSLPDDQAVDRAYYDLIKSGGYRFYPLEEYDKWQGPEE